MSYIRQYKGSSSLFEENNQQRIQIETDNTSFGHITTQQSQHLDKVTILTGTEVYKPIAEIKTTKKFKKHVNNDLSDKRKSHS